MNKEKIIEQYIKSGNIMYEATLSGDYKKGNREGRELHKLFKKIAENKELAKEIYDELFKSENPELLVKIATECLMIKANEKKALEILNIIAKDEEKYKIFSFNAKMTLEAWKKGELKMY